MVKSHVEESLGANPGDAALNPADSVAMGVPSSRAPRFLRSSKGRAFRALVHRPYRLLFSAFLINQTGFWISHISLQGQMVELSENDPIMLGLLFFALFVPAFLLAPLAGVAADRYDRKHIMITCYAGVATLMATFIGLTVSEMISPALMLCVGFLLGTCFAFSGPASFAVAANTVPDDDLPSAVSLQSAANNLTRVLGPALAAPVVASGRFELAFCVFFVAALVAAFLTSRMQIAAYAPDTDGGGIFARGPRCRPSASSRRSRSSASLTPPCCRCMPRSYSATAPTSPGSWPPPASAPPSARSSRATNRARRCAAPRCAWGSTPPVWAPSPPPRTCGSPSEPRWRSGTSTSRS
jgi:MFS family permease